MSTIKFVPMEFFAQFALTQMRRLQARGAVGAALGVRGGVGGRRSLFVRLFRRGVPIVNAGRCRRGFPGTGTSLADVGRCRRGFPGAGRDWRSWGRRLRAWGAVGAAFQAREHRWQTWDAACGRGALSARLFLVRGRRWWAQVAACGHEALSAGAGCCRRGFFEHGNIIGGCGELLVGAGRCLRHEALLADAGRRLRSFFRRAGAPPRLAHAPALPRGARCLPLGLPFGCTSPSPRRGACFPARPLAARPPPFRRAACRFAA